MHAVLFSNFREFLRVSPLSSAGAPLHVCCVGRASRLTACARVSVSGPSDFRVPCRSHARRAGRGVVRKPLRVFARSCYDTKILPYTISLIPTSRRARVTPSVCLVVVHSVRMYACIPHTPHKVCTEVSLSGKNTLSSSAPPLVRRIQ